MKQKDKLKKKKNLKQEQRKENIQTKLYTWDRYINQAGRLKYKIIIIEKSVSVSRKMFLN